MFHRCDMRYAWCKWAAPSVLMFTIKINFLARRSFVGCARFSECLYAKDHNFRWLYGFILARNVNINDLLLLYTAYNKCSINYQSPFNLLKMEIVPSREHENRKWFLASWIEWYTKVRRVRDVENFKFESWFKKSILNT